MHREINYAAGVGLVGSSECGRWIAAIHKRFSPSRMAVASVCLVALSLLKARPSEIMIILINVC